MSIADEQVTCTPQLGVHDMRKKILSTWGLRDHSSDILLFNASGEMFFSIEGKLADAQIGELVDRTWKSISSRHTDAGK